MSRNPYRESARKPTLTRWIDKVQARLKKRFAPDVLINSSFFEVPEQCVIHFETEKALQFVLRNGLRLGGVDRATLRASVGIYVSKADVWDIVTKMEEAGLVVAVDREILP